MIAHDVVMRIAYGSWRPTGEGRRGSVPPQKPKPEKDKKK